MNVQNSSENELSSFGGGLLTIHLISPKKPSESLKGCEPEAISIKEIPSDHISALIEYPFPLSDGSIFSGLN